MLNSSFKSTFEYKLIYVFRINDKAHSGCLKVGEATLKTNQDESNFSPNCKELNRAAKKRIDEYTSTAGIEYELLHTEIAVITNGNKKEAFRDYQVHKVLKRSGIKNKYFSSNKKQNEWFETDLETVKNAIKAVKEGKTALNDSEVSNDRNPIIFRPEQVAAIDKTIQRFKKDTVMLWNAKMRFGKTLTTLEVVKRMNFKRTIIITHRPVVSEGWYEDFTKIFYDKPNYSFGSKTRGKSVAELLQGDQSFVYFASMQDLRGSEVVGGNFDKNSEIFKTKWDMVVIDEAHEGTKTDLGGSVLEHIIKNKEDHKTHVLHLSGTPFNLLRDFVRESIYTWDYTMEQEAKHNWYLNNFGDSNPYAELPRMNIFTYHLENNLPQYADVYDKAFNFREFFKIEENETFAHKEDILGFLNLLCKEDDKTNYPFSTQQYRDYFRHTLWVVPGVKEAKALSQLLKSHPVFKHFNIANVAGDGDEDANSSSALELVREAISEDPNNTYSITISCGRLTTGVTVPEWTAVLMLAGTYSTAASQYLQTIFRVQSPANINGKIKEECYVFDFAPDRTLKVIAESVHLSSRAGVTNRSAEKSLEKFLNYCSVIAIEESNMKQYNVSQLLQQLKKAYAERVARNGFDDVNIYSKELLNLTDIEITEFNKLKNIVGASKQTKKVSEIEINDEGFDDVELEWDESSNRPSVMTEEERARRAELQAKRKKRDTAISILRAISIRMPLLVYGMNVPIEEEINIDNFADKVTDESSWKEFMPAGITKQIFKQFSKYYDKDIFIGASNRIRQIAKQADELDPEERVKEIGELFSTFRNPDKETVLTPWRVVNMHLGHTIGGYSFYDDKLGDLVSESKLVKIDEVTDKIFEDGRRILEINSKTGLYPLYMAYSFYRTALSKYSEEVTHEKKLEIWDDIVSKNIYVICKTPMAKHITQRTLLGYRPGKVHMHAFEDIIMQLKEKPEQFIEKVKSKRFWGIGGNENMKFGAVIGNPPYQVMDGGAQASAVPVYNYFVDASQRITENYSTMIMPSRWMTGGRGLDKFRKSMIEDKRMRILHDYLDGKKIFTNVEIKGGICYFLWDAFHSQKCNIHTHKYQNILVSKRYLQSGKDEIYVRDPNLMKLLEKVKAKGCESFSKIVSPLRPFGLRGDVFKDWLKYELPEMSKSPLKDGYTVYGLEEGNRRTRRYVESDYPFSKNEFLEGYKLFVARNQGSGVFGEKFSDFIKASKKDICTETYVAVGPFKSEFERDNCQMYMKTKFFRACLGIKKNDQNASQGVYEFVPLVSFDRVWDDESLYKEFNLDEDIIRFIEENVKPMK